MEAALRVGRFPSMMRLNLKAGTGVIKDYLTEQGS
jgi:hypothetical protein